MAGEAEIRTTLERYAKAWAAGELGPIMACYHDAFTLHYFGRNSLSGDHVGKAAALTTLAEFSRRTGRRLKAVTHVLAGPERGCLIAREVLGPQAVEAERVLVFAVKDGLLADCWVYDQDQRMIDELIGPD